MHIPPLIENSASTSSQSDDDPFIITLNQIQDFIESAIVCIVFLFAIPLYIFSAAFLFTQNNYKFTFCCSREKFDFYGSREDAMFFILIIFFYIVEFIFMFCSPFVFGTSAVSLLFCIRSIIISILHIIASVWLSVKVNFISIFYIVTTILNLIIGVVHFIIYKLQKRLEEEIQSETA
jgi:hypothetical protein